MGAKTITGKVMQGAIRAYQLLIVPVLPAGGCRFHPTCSHYAMDAVGLHGPIAGGWLTLKRILRCHPWGKAGVDPVPPPSASIPPEHAAGGKEHQRPEHCAGTGMVKSTGIAAG